MYIVRQLWNRKYWIVVVFLLALGCDSQQKQETQQSVSSEVTESVTPAPRAEDWHTFMHDLNFSGMSADKSLAPPLALLWKFKTGGPVYASPVIANGVLYIGSTDGKLYALDAKQWGIKWVFDAGDAIRYSAAVLGDRVYFNARNNKVYALNANTGEKLWEFKSKNWMDAPPIVADDKVYVGAFRSTIYVLDARTGTLESRREQTIQIRGTEYGCANGVFRPISPEHKAKLWRGQTAGSESYPVTANGRVYIGARDGQLHAFDMASQTEVWAYQLGGFVEAAPAIADGILYAASGDGWIYAFANQSEVGNLASGDRDVTDITKGNRETGNLASGDRDVTDITKGNRETGNLASGDRVMDTRQMGIVVHDTAPVYADKTGMAVLLNLNDGVRLPIMQTSAGWYAVELPNGVRGWMDQFAFGEFEGTDGILFNTNFINRRDLPTAPPRRMQLIEGAEFPRWSPDGELIAFLKRNDVGSRYWRANELWIMDRKGEQARKLCTGQFYNPHVSWSLDSRLLALEVDEDGKRSIWTVDWQLGRIKQLARGEGPAWSPTSNRLVFRRREKGMDVIYRINSDGSGLRAIARVPIERRQRTHTYLPAPAWSPDGTRVAFGVNSAKYVGIRIQDIEGQRLKEIQTQHQQVHRLNWSADGTQLAYVLSGSNRPGQRIDKQLQISASAPALTQSQILKHTSPAWSPTGKQLAYMEREDCEGLRWKVWVYDLESGKKFPIARTAMKLTSVVWAPDGKYLCLWQTSDYLRDNAYKPALTTGWIVPVDVTGL